MGKLKRRLIAAASVIILFAMTLLPSLFQGGSSPPKGSAPAEPPDTGQVLASGGGPAPTGTRVRTIGGLAEAEVGVGANGAFRFDRVPAGTTGFEARCGPLRASAKGPAPVVIRLPESLDVAGRVVSAYSGDPIAGARVSVGERVAETDDRGRFTVGGVAVPLGTPPTIRVTAPGHPEHVLRPKADSSWDDLFIRLVAR